MRSIRRENYAMLRMDSGITALCAHKSIELIQPSFRAGQLVPALIRPSILTDLLTVYPARNLNGHEIAAV